MSWTDRTRIETFHKLRDEFNVKQFVETGTFKGIGAELFSHYFDVVYTVEHNIEYAEIAGKRLIPRKNVYPYITDSSVFLKEFIRRYDVQKRNDVVFFYLDAHFYNPLLPIEEKWVAVKELHTLRGFTNCIVVIDDFDCNNMGHLVYEGEHFGWGVVAEHIKRVNPDFHYYVNTRDSCRVFDEQTIYETPITVDEDVLDNIRYMHSSDEKRYRGALYAVPKRLDLSKYKLVEFHGT